MKAKRTQLFKQLSEQLTNQSKENITTLYHHVHSMKLGEDYIYKTEKDFQGLINYLNQTPEYTL